MAFGKEPSRVPAAIADIEVRIFSPDPAGAGVAGINYSIQVRMSDGSVRVLTGNLVPQLTAGQINTLTAFMDTLRTKAVAEILP